VVVHVDTDNATADALNAHWGPFNPTFPILTQCDSLMQTWGEGYIPHTTILDPQGIVRGNWVGWSEAFGQQMHATVIAHLNPTGLYYSEHGLLEDSDGDGMAEPGEELLLEVWLENRGAAAVAGVVVELACDEPWVLIESGSADYGEIEAGALGSGVQPFALSLAAEAPQVADLVLRLQIASEAGNAMQSFVLAVGERQSFWETACEDEDGWSHGSSGGWGNPWHLSSADQQSGSHAWKAGSTGAGNYANHLDGRLVTPAVELLEHSRLSFLHRIQAEVSGAFPDSAYDGGIVEISLDEGASWQQLPSLTGYNKAFRWLSGGGNPASHPFPGGTPCYSGEFDWEEAVFDLEAFAGQEVRFGFRFGSDNGGGGEGWYIDDLRLSGYIEQTGTALPFARPLSLRLEAPRPNPFNPAALIVFELGQAGPVELSVHDLAGRLRARLHSGALPAGIHERRLDGTGLASGLYLIRLEAGGESAARKALLVK
jgi:hypothetical protein